MSSAIAVLPNALRDERRRAGGLVGPADRGDEDRVEVGALEAGHLQGRPGGEHGHVDDRLAVPGPAPLDDAGALADPLVGGVDALDDLGVGDDPSRPVAADAGDAGVRPVGVRGAQGPREALGGDGHAECSLMRVRAASRSSGVLTASSSTPLSARLASPTRVPAGGSSMIAVTPRSVNRSMHRSQRTGLDTCATSRSSTSRPSATTAPSRLETSVTPGSETSWSAAAARSALDRGLPCSACGRRPATLSGMTRAWAGGSAAKAGEGVERARGDDLAGAVDVGRGEAVASDRREHLVGVAAEHRAHAGGGGGAGLGHRAAAQRDEAHRVVLGEHAGARRPR